MPLPISKNDVICGLLLIVSGTALAQSDEHRLSDPDAIKLDVATTGQPISRDLAEDLSALFHFDARFARTHLDRNDSTAAQFINSSSSGKTISLARGFSARSVHAAPAGSTRVSTVDENSIRISSIPFTISQPGAYRLADNLSNTVADADGISITTSQVTLDLGGFVLSADTTAGGDGIVVVGEQNGIRILNGHVTGWSGDGINADTCDSCTFEDLSVSNNTQNGLLTGSISTVRHVTASFNGQDGIDVDRSSVVTLSIARDNGGTGIQGSVGVVITQSGGFANFEDGINVGAGSSIANCTARDNLRYGFEMGSGSIALQSAASDNGENGFDAFFASYLRDNIASTNGSETDSVSGNNGFRASANSFLINNQAYENDGAGIRITSGDSVIESNMVTDNDRVGIEAIAGGNLIIRNRASGNLSTDNPLNYDWPNNNSFGPIIDVEGINDLSTITNSDHSYANLSY